MNTLSKKPEYVTGYSTNKGLLLDLDRTTLQEALYEAKYHMKTYNLEGYLLIESSALNHHIVFNRKMKWKKVLHILFRTVWRYHYHQHGRMPSLTNWAILQAINGFCCLRITSKHQKGHPKILMRIGKQNKIIKEYLEAYNTFNEDKKMSLYKKLRKNHYIYCQGKRPSVLKASCKYIKTLLNGEWITQQTIAKEYNITPMAIRRRYREIMELLGITY